MLDPAELGVLVVRHGTMELHTGPYALGLQLRRDLNGGCGSFWDGGGRERAGGACGDMHEGVCMCVTPDASPGPREPHPKIEGISFSR